MSDVPGGNYRDWCDVGSEHSSCDEAGYESSNDGPRRSTSGSVASNDDRLRGHPAFRRTSSNEGEEDEATKRYREPAASQGNLVHKNLATLSPSAQNAPAIQERGDVTAEANSRRATNAHESMFVTSSRDSPSDRGNDFVGQAHAVRDAEVPSSFAPSRPDLLSLVHQGSQINQEHRMGPPLSRTLLIHNTREGSVKSFGSDDGRALSYEGAGNSPFHGSTSSATSQVNEMSDTAEGKIHQHSSHTLVGYVEEGSRVGAEAEDCACSLDVETHSVHSMGTRSVYSQDDTSYLPLVETATIHDVPPFDTRRLEVLNDDMRRDFEGTLDAERTHHRQSFLPLPMERFHAEGSALGITHDPSTSSRDRVHGWSGDGNFYRHRRVAQRSRSRSRSPDNHDGDDDRKPAACENDDDSPSWDHRRAS